MLNIEKYKDEIIQEYKDSISYTIGDCIAHVKRNHTCANSSTSGIAMIDWLCEEYKEPILTDKEREYLKAVCEPFHERINYVANIEGAGGKKLIIHYDDCYVIYLPSIEQTFMNMELDKSYTLEELGIEYGDEE